MKLWLVVSLFILSIVPSDSKTSPRVGYDHRSEYCFPHDRISLAKASVGEPVTPILAEAGNPTEEQRNLSNPQSTEGETEFWPPYHGYRLKITDTLIAGFTALLFLATWLLWRATKRLVEGAQDTSVRQLRAYISINPKMLSGFGTQNFVQVECLTRNHGQTPASEIIHEYQMDVLPNPLPEDFVWPQPTIQIDQEQGLFPGNDMKTWFTYNRLLTNEETDAIENDARRLYIWGTTHYRTVFGARYATSFRFHVGGARFVESVRAVNRGKPDGGFSWAYGAGHNQGT